MQYFGIDIIVKQFCVDPHDAKNKFYDINVNENNRN